MSRRLRDPVDRSWVFGYGAMSSLGLAVGARRMAAEIREAVPGRRRSQLAPWLEAVADRLEVAQAAGEAWQVCVCGERVPFSVAGVEAMRSHVGGCLMAKEA